MDIRDTPICSAATIAWMHGNFSFSKRRHVHFFHPHLQHAKMLHKLLERGKHQSFVHPEVLTRWHGSISEKKQETKQIRYGWVILVM